LNVVLRGEAGGDSDLLTSKPSALQSLRSVPMILHITSSTQFIPCCTESSQHWPQRTGRGFHYSLNTLIMVINESQINSPCGRHLHSLVQPLHPVRRLGGHLHPRKGLLKNTSEVQPTPSSMGILPGAVNAVCSASPICFCIKLMPRIRISKDLRFFRPSKLRPDIDTLSTICSATIILNGPGIETHTVAHLLQVVLDQQAPSVGAVARRLGIVQPAHVLTRPSANSAVSFDSVPPSI